MFIISICYILRKNFKTMEAKVKTQRKVIDIKPETFQGLTVIAASRGTNLKHFIETSLDELVDSYNDSMLYSYLRRTEPDGLEKVSEEEKVEFEKMLGL